MDEILAEAYKLAQGCRTGPTLMGHLQIQALAIISAQLECIVCNTEDLERAVKSLR